MADYMNIPPDVKDEHYRYKMPRPIIKVEGRGNGIKTVLVNLQEMSEAMKVPLEYPLKYFGSELGAQSKWDAKNEKAIVNGQLDMTTVMQLLTDFIKKFVLCERCHLPETTIHINKHENIDLKCQACGHVTQVDPQEKICTFIVKNPPKQLLDREKSEEKKSEDEKREEDEREDESDEDFKQVKPIEDDKDVEWSEDVSEEAVRRRREEEGLSSRIQELTTIDDEEEELEINPVELFKEFLKTKPDATETQLLRATLKIKKDYELADKDCVCLLFEAFFDENIVSQIKNRAKIIRRFIKGQVSQKLILAYTEELLSKHEELIPYMSVILELYYDNELLEEEVILDWAKRKKGKFVKDATTVRKIKEAAKPFLNWLQEAQVEAQ